MEKNKQFDLYEDMKARTNGEIYIGILGPVRTGKSTFIKNFMQKLVIPGMTDENERSRLMDQIPQSAAGKMVMTTQPNFVPKEAAGVTLGNGTDVKVRLIDCVGYMVEGATGHMDDDKERMVKTPWFTEEIPFSEAARIGTDKVMKEHSTIGLVITTDGSFGDIPRKSYLVPEERTIMALKSIHKPFLVVLNTARPYAQEAVALAEELQNKYGVRVLPINCEQLKTEDIVRILESILYEFPIRSISFKLPGWSLALSTECEMKKKLAQLVRELTQDYSCVRDFFENPIRFTNEYVTDVAVEKIGFCDGEIVLRMEIAQEHYYRMLSDMIGEDISDDVALVNILTGYREMKKEYKKVEDAMMSVRMKGYGVALPGREEITISEPEVIKHSGKYGVKMKASSPSIHFIRANIETEIAPIVGTEQQAKDLIGYLQETKEDGASIWETNIFGKTVEQLVCDGISTKIASLGDESRLKLQDTMQKVVNDNTGGMVCIII